MEVNFSNYDTYSTDCLTQWDTNQTLNISGLKLDAAPVILFSNRMSVTAEPVNATYKNNVISCPIPNGMLAYDYPIIAYIRVSNGSTTSTIGKIKIPVLPKPKPDDYQFIDNIIIISYESLLGMINSKSDKTDLEDIKSRISEIETSGVSGEIVSEKVKSTIDDMIESGDLTYLLVADHSIDDDKLSQSLMEKINKTDEIENVKNTVFGKTLSLPGVIDDPDYILSGSPILLSSGDNKLSPELTFTKSGTNGDYDPHTGKVTSIGNSNFGTWLHVPLERVKKYYFHAIASNAATMKINLYGSNNNSSTGGTVIKQISAGDSIDMAEYDEYQYYNIAILTVTPNLNVPFSLVAYFGETQNNNLVLSNDNLSAKDYVGFIMLNSDNASAKSGGLESGITENMPSKKSVLLTNKDSEIAKYEKPFSFRNTYAYLDNGENKYFCWNNNMLHYDKNIHKYVYICKNKSTHTSSGDNNEYMYLIDPVDPLSAEPQKIYTKEGKQITWCQGFIIKEDGTWILADCTVSDYDTPKMIRSTDHGKTFEIIGDFNPPTSGAYFNSINLGFNGRIFGSYDDGTISTTKHDSMISYSDDDGLTWIDLPISGQKFVEQLILPISDKRLALIGRYNAYGSSEQKAVTAYSDDNGITWNFFNSDMKMHANDCAGFVHNGLIELFCLERYYTNNFRVGEMTGQLTHYIGTADDFINNKMIEYEVHYLMSYESADLGHPSACMDEYGGAMVITSANKDKVVNNTYPLVMWSDCNKISGN